jgi:hypothetical protein
MSRRLNSGLAPAIIIGVLATAAIIGGAVVIFSGVLDDAPSPNPQTNPTATPTVTPTASPTATQTASPTPTATPTASPSPTPTASPTPSPSPSPSPTPEPVATAFQNATISYGGYNEVNYTITWVVNGTLINTETTQGISGLTVSVVDATNSTLVYGTVVTGDNGYFEYTVDMMQPPSVQLVFAGNEQYVAVTSSTIQQPT